MREAVMRLTVEGHTDQQIADTLGQTVGTIRRYRAKSMDRVIERITVTGEDVIEPTPPPRRFKAPRRGPGPGPHRPNSKKIPVEVIDPPEEARLRREVLKLRKMMQPLDVIAERLDLTEKRVHQLLADELQRLQDSELVSADMERRLMVEQLDDMIRAIYPYTTGDEEFPGEDKKKLPISLEAIDRMLKLMDRKSKLLGLDRTPAVDIVVKLQEIAITGNYEIAELEDIARDVLTRRKMTVPPRLLGDPDAVV
jgi:hypothetical protein